MNKKLLLLSCFCLLNLTNCDQTMSSDNNSSDFSAPSSNTSNVFDKDELLNEDYSDLKLLNSTSNTVSNWDNNFKDQQFNSDDLKYEEVYKNNKLVNGKVEIGAKDDVKYVFYEKNKARFISNGDGYAFTLPTNCVLKTDFSLGLYRSKLYNKEYTLTISNEHSNPYNSWELYRREWLFRYLDNENYYTQNGLKSLYKARKSDLTFMNGYVIDHYDVMIDEPGQIRKNYYNIGVIRKGTDHVNFILLVMKSTDDMHQEFENILLSYKEVSKKGSVNNDSMLNLPVSTNPMWSEETKNYYNQLLTEDRTNWGAFVATIPEGEMSESNLKNTDAYKKFNALQEAFDYKFDILPTYQHIAWNRMTLNISWPTTSANVMGHGNGTNGLPVLQMSYQFTDNNNNVTVSNTTDCYTPMFDIYRGDNDLFNTPRNRYYNRFLYLARNLKAYKSPVLFRLNNEMNTDWTSYSGIMSLLDPDIFQATWRLMFNIFKANGVDNCIWIFNPIAKSCPFSSWGEDLCYYPGIDFVNALGLTYYEANNDDDKVIDETTFRKDYTELYEKNNPVWNNYPWIISEFACGSGGDSEGKERFRNADSQALYIKGMFADLNDRANHPYLHNIKGAVWFSVNDYGTDSNGNLNVINQLELEIDKLPLSIQAFKEGLAKNKR